MPEREADGEEEESRGLRGCRADEGKDFSEPAGPFHLRVIRSRPSPPFPLRSFHSRFSFCLSFCPPNFSIPFHLFTSPSQSARSVARYSFRRLPAASASVCLAICELLMPPLLITPLAKRLSPPLRTNSNVTSSCRSTTLYGSFDTLRSAFLHLLRVIGLFCVQR